VRLISLQAENFKRLKAVRIEPDGSLVQITGKNGAGKTSVLDAIAAALGGKDAAPDMPVRTGHEKAFVLLDLEDLIVKRRWTKAGSSLEVTLKDGTTQASPQSVLDRLIGKLAIDPLAFMRQKPREQMIGLARIAELDLAAIEEVEKGHYNARTGANREVTRLETLLKSLPVVNGPDKEVSIAELAGELQAAEASQNAVDAARQGLDFAKRAATDAASEIARLEEQLAAARDRLKIRKAQVEAAGTKLFAAEADAVDATELRQRIEAVEAQNAAARQRRERAKVQAELVEAQKVASEADDKVREIRRQRDEAVAAVDLPVKGLTIGTDCVLLNGVPLSQASSAEQLRLSAAIALASNPTLRLVLIRDGSLLDTDSMRFLAEFAEQHDAQILVERVEDVDAGVGIRIEDGEVAK
jgi:DNA repair exonuclease SbcCD ATPase subunit